MTAIELEILADERDVERVLIRYAHSLDARDWDGLGECFTEDATTDYGEVAGDNAGRAEIVSTCRDYLSGLDASQHLIGSVSVECDGDTASAVCYLQAQHVLRGAAGGDNFLLGGIYRDRLTRGAGGWQITHRTLEVVWVQGNLAVPDLATARWAARQG